MEIYNYSLLTGEYIGPSQADESPLEPGVFLIPAGATTTVPPQVESQQIAVFINGSWSVEPDFRGTIVYSLADLSPVIISQIGSLPEGVITEKPVKPVGNYTWNGEAYILEPLTAQQVSLNQAENNFILFCRALKVPDLATLTEIKVAGRQLKASNQTLTFDGDVLTGDEIFIDALALIHEVEVNGGTWSSITWHDDVTQ